MDWIKNLNNALKFIENNLDGKIDYTEIANSANTSKFHFLRTFSMFTGKTVGEYVKERRLSKATKDLLDGREKIIDIALKYGYENHGAFSKAFKRFHGISPSQVNKTNRVLKAAPPLKFSLTVKGEEIVDYRIEKREKFRVIGKSITIPYMSYKPGEKFWKEEISNGNWEKLNNLSSELGVMGINYNPNDEKKEISYMIGIEAKEIIEPANEIIDIPKLTWAIFNRKGPMPDSMSKLWSDIMKEWFPATDYIHADAPALERYISWDQSTGIHEFEIMIPIETNKN